MTPLSNDILADRRIAWASALSAEGDHAAAADLFEQVVERLPDWAPGWALLGDARERSGRPDAALAAWRCAARLDHTGRLGADLHVARLAGETPALMPAAYLRALFDDYAPRFDRHLVEGLGYRAPQVLAEAVVAVTGSAVTGGRGVGRALDLGCGTGLMGRALGRLAARLDGVDLSAAMIEAARASGAYDGLAVGSIEAALAAADAGRYDLVLAADVLVYLGDLAPVLHEVARVLAPGGLFAFTAQRDEGGSPGGFVLGADLRFAHSRDYVETVVAAAGLCLPRLDETSTRTEQGRPVPGLVAVARRA